MTFFFTLLAIQNYLFYISFIVSAFLFALLYKNKARLYYAFVFLATALVAILVLPCNSTTGFLDAYIIIAAALIMTAFLHKGKHTILYVWLLELVKTLFALFWGWYFINFFTVLYFMATMLPFELGFLIVLTVIRARREKRERLESATQRQAADGYYSGRVGASGLLIAGNIMSFISFVLTITFISIILNSVLFIESQSENIYYGYGVFHPDSLNMGLGIACIVIAGILSIISLIMLKYARIYGHEPTPIDTALYIWSWVIPIVIIAVMVMIFAVFCTATGGESFSERSKKQVYTVKDENGEKRKLDYKGGLCEQCTDDKGYVWETSDGGSTFVKRDYYKIKDENGKEHTIHKYGMDTSGSYYVDKDGKEYKDGEGNTLEETGNDSPFNANYY